MIPTLPEAAGYILRIISQAGGRGYLVGGALRDLMRGEKPHDWDFATTLSPGQLLEVFPGSVQVGGVYGTVKAPFGDGGWCEITPCRTEYDYTDKRHPGRVVFVPDILADLSRRDFTVNAMAYDGHILLDPFGGQQDLQAKLLRCVGDANQRFAEDALRVLRLFRLAAQLDFTAEWNTFCAANAAMGHIASLPKERVAEELRLILLSDGPQVLGGVIAKGGLAPYGFEFAPAMASLSNVPRNLLCRWWALIALCGADPNKVIKSLGFSTRMACELETCTRLYRMGPAANAVELKQKLSRASIDYAPVAATFAAVSPTFAAEPAMFALICANKEPYRLKDLAVNGDMLRYEGINGEKCGRILNELLLSVIKNPELNQTPILLGLARGLRKIL